VTVVDTMLAIERGALRGTISRGGLESSALGFIFFGMLCGIGLLLLVARRFRAQDGVLAVCSVFCLLAAFLYLAPGLLPVTLSAASFHFTFSFDFDATLFTALTFVLAFCVARVAPERISREQLFVFGYGATFFVLAAILSRDALHDWLVLALRLFLLAASAFFLLAISKSSAPRDLRAALGFGLLLFPMSQFGRLLGHTFGASWLDPAYFCLPIFACALAALRVQDVCVACGALEQEVASYERFVPKEFLELVQRSITDVRLGDSTEVAMSVLFADIRDFTMLSEQMTPEENFKFVNSYCEVMGELIKKNGGFIDKFIGDAIMALFPGPADGAVKCSVEMLQRLEDYNEGRIRAGYTPIRIGVGINSGILRLGTVGDAGRLQGTVIGDAVNTASRLESLTKQFGVSILVSDATYSLLADATKFHLRRLGKVRAKGKKEEIVVWEVFDRDNIEMQRHKIMVAETFDDAVRLFDARQYAEALTQFQNCIANNEADVTARYYQDKCRLFLEINKNGGQEGVSRVVRYERYID